MTEYLSRKLKVLSALLILMVIYIHTYYTEGESMKTLKIIESIIGGRICSVAVPLFYVISGYLFFLKVPDRLRSISQKLRKRVRTLLVPYLIANALTFLFYLALNLIAIQVPAIDRLLNFKVLVILASMDWSQQLSFIFISPPIAFQLWFVRDLMLVMLFSPLLYFILQKSSISRMMRIIVVAILIASYCYFQKSLIACAFIWFSTGGLFAVKFNKEIVMQSNLPFITGVLAIIFLTYCILDGCEIITSPINWVPVLGIPTLWLLYDIIANKWPGLIVAKTTTFLCSYTFFVYLCHEPLLNIFKKVPLLISNTEGYLITLYLLLPPLFYILASLLGAGLKRAIPTAYAVYTGGR